MGFHRFHTEGLCRGNFLTHRVSYNPHLHIAKNFIALVNAALSPTPGTYSKTVIDDDELVLARAAVTDLQRTAVQDRIRETPSIAPRFIGWSWSINASAMLIQRRWPRIFPPSDQMILNRYENI